MYHRSFLSCFIGILYLLLGPFSLKGQITVYGIGLDSIESWVDESPGYFDSLNLKCIHRDSAMASEEYLLLYYGSAYLESYTPYGEKTIMVPMAELMSEKKYEEAIEMGITMIEENPAFTKGYLYLSIAYDELGDTTAADFYLDRYYGLLSIPFYSGNGETTETAFVVRTVEDEYLILRELGRSMKSQALIQDDNNIPYDEFTIETEAGEVTDKEKKLYFNIYQPFVIGMKNMFDLSEEDRKPDKKRI